MREIWKISRACDRYAVSSTGIVMSIYGRKIGRILKHYYRLNGYPYVRLYDGTKYSNWRVNRLVAFEFIGQIPKKMHVAHIDGNRLNNSVSNLKICSAKENIADKANHGTKLFGERHHNSKITARTARRIVLMRKKGFGYQQIADEFRVGRSLVGAVLIGKTWSHVTGVTGVVKQNIEDNRDVI